MVDVNEVVRDTLALRAYEQRLANIGVIDALAAGLPHVFADGHQLQQVLLNLVINAEQAMLGGERAAARWSCARGTTASATSVLLEVNDDGPGLPPRCSRRSSTRSSRRRKSGKGTGLGLTVAYAIVQEHGGAIRRRRRARRRARRSVVELPARGDQAPRRAPDRGR